MRAPTTSDWFHLIPAAINIGIAIFFTRLIKRSLRAQEEYARAKEQEDAAMRAAEMLRNAALRLLDKET